MALILFVLGLAVGSFLNVVALRYDPDRFLLSAPVIGGRSRCPGCRKKLAAWELVPLLSFLIQRGRCRECHMRLSFQYPLVEIITGFIFVLIPVALQVGEVTPPSGFEIALWIGVFVVLLLIALIDLRLTIIPDELSIALVALALPLIALQEPLFGLTSGSFLGPYAALFGLRDNIWVNHIAAAVFALFFYGAIIAVTRGRGMGIGDLKLAGALGLVFGWPDIGLVTALGFILGACVGVGAMVVKKKNIKGALPFGPFLALGAFFVFFYGGAILRFYFSLFP